MSESEKMTPDFGGTAFPVPDSPLYNAELGMTLLDYFAGKTLVAMGTWTPGKDGRFDSDLEAERSRHQRRAMFAYDQAEAMLAERKRRGLE